MKELKKENALMKLNDDENKTKKNDDLMINSTSFFDDSISLFDDFISLFDDQISFFDDYILFFEESISLLDYYI